MSRDVVVVGAIDRFTIIEGGKVGSTEIVEDEISQLRLNGSTLYVGFFNKSCVSTYKISSDLIEKTGEVYSSGILSLQLANGSLTAELDQLVYQN